MRAGGGWTAVAVTDFGGDKPGMADVVLIGRVYELGRIARLLDDHDGDEVGLVLVGEAGSGKSSLLRAGADLARERGLRVLTAAPSEAERDLPLAALRDLFDGVALPFVDQLPSPQRHALEVALLDADPGPVPPARHTLAAAVLGVLRRLSSDGGVLLILDEVQWADEPTVEVLAFALRRLAGAPVRLLAAERTAFGSPPGLTVARLDPLGIPSLTVDALTIEEIGALCRARIGYSLPADLVARIHDATRGNPLFALEVARLVDADPREQGRRGPLPLPADLRRLLRRRLEELAPPVLDALQVAAASAAPTTTLLLEAAVEASAIDGAVAEGLLAVDATGTVRFTHPLYAAGALDCLGPMALRSLHRRMADVVTDPDDRARHLAASVEGPSEPVAAELDAAAERLAARGSPDAAGELLEVASRLTPERSPDRLHRAVRAAVHHMASDVPRGRRLLEGALDAAPPGRDRAEIRYWLAYTSSGELDDSRAILGAALDEVEGDRHLETRIRILDAFLLWLRGRTDVVIDAAEASLRLAHEVGDVRLIASVEHLLAGFYCDAGLPVPWDLYEHAEEVELRLGLPPLSYSAQVGHGIALLLSDRFEEARVRLEAALTRAMETGDEVLRGEAAFFLAQLELRVDRFEEGHELAEVVLQLSVAQSDGADSQDLAGSLFVLAYAQAFLGDVVAARDNASRGSKMSATVGDPFFETQNEAVLGFIALSEGDTATAAAHLRTQLDALAAMGRSDSPLCFLVGVLAFEAMIAVGSIEDARGHLDRFEMNVRRAGRSLGMAQAARCRGLLLATEGRVEEALERFNYALELHATLPSRFEEARTRLALGATLRRLKRKRDARLELERALALFEAVGTPLWVERARDELVRIGGRPAAPTDLTETERRVADLVAAGRTNREVAAALFISVRTVESNLSRIYAKLGVRNRSELAHRHAGSSPLG